MTGKRKPPSGSGKAAGDGLVMIGKSHDHGQYTPSRDCSQAHDLVRLAFFGGQP
jgi:hypothetical protein